MKSTFDRFVLTGAGGYLGTHLRRYLADRGMEVFGSTRSDDSSEVRTFSWQLGDDLPSDLLGTTTIVVHLAASTRPTRRGLDPHGMSSDTEVRAARRLLEQSARAGARLVFVSSQSASPSSPSHYGRVKWQIERDVLAAGQFVVRFGLVHGGDQSGLLGRMAEWVRRYPVLPVPYPSPKVQLTSIDEAIASLASFGRAALSPGLFCVAEDERTDLTTLLRSLARDQNRRRLFLPFPKLLLDAAWAATRNLESPFLLPLDQLLALDRSKKMQPSRELTMASPGGS